MTQEGSSKPTGGWPAFIGALLFLLPLGWGVFCFNFNAALSDGAAAPHLNVAGAIEFLIVTAVPLGLCILAFRRRTGPTLAVLSLVGIAGFAVLTFRATSSLVGAVATAHQEAVYQDRQTKLRQWADLGKAVNPAIAAYIMKDRSKVHPTGEDEFIEVDGLADYLRAKNPGLPFHGNVLLDPWGQPVRIGMDLNGDSVLKGGNTSYGVWHKNGNVIAVGIYSAAAAKACWHDGTQWITDGGVIEKPRPGPSGR